LRSACFIAGRAATEFFAMLALMLCVSLACSAPALADDLAGDYAGWAYIDTGGDLPFRLHIEIAETGPIITFDLPSQGEFGLATENTGIDAGTLRFERTSSTGKRWTFTAKHRNGEVTGEATIGDDLRLAFDLVHSALPLPSPPPTIDAADYIGAYRAADGQSIVITSWFWDELRYVDTQTGRVGTLFLLNDQTFFAGPEEYVPAPVTATFEFELNDAEAATALMISATAGEAKRFERAELVEEEVRFRSGEAELHGTLIKPAGDGPHPAIVIAGGSDWQKRGQVRREADIFASFGLASFIYDKRGHGESTGDTVVPFGVTASDMAAAVHVLRERGDIRRDAVGVFGRSRGGWFAPLAAANHEGVAFVIVFVAPAISPAEQETTRRLQAMNDAGHGETELAEARAYLELLWAATTSDEAWERYVQARDAIEARGWGDMLGGLAEPDSEDAQWNRLNMRYDPIPALQRVRCPIFALFGEADTNVTPAQNFEPFRAALERAGNDDATVLVIPRADHGLRPVDPEAPAVPLHRAVGYAPEVWRGVREWLRERGLSE
jgi:pimeloyl-ACP methyl ester carboxylesterase